MSTMITASTLYAVVVSVLAVSLGVSYVEHARAERLRKELETVVGDREITEDELEKLESSLQPSYYD